MNNTQWQIQDTPAIVAGEAGLAGLQWLLHSPAMQAWLHDQVAALLTQPEQCSGCTLQRVKVKPGHKVTAYYDVALRDESGAPSHRPIEVTWRAATAAAEETLTPAQLQQMAEIEALALAAPFRRLALADGATAMQIQVAPLDSAFPHLPRLYSPPHLRVLLAPLLGLPPKTMVQVQPIRYRPRQRHVLRLTLSTDETPPTDLQHFFAKVYQAGAGAVAAQMTTIIADRLAMAQEPLTALRPIAHLRNEELLLYPAVTGLPLTQALPQGGHSLGDTLQTIGAALHHLHRAPLTPALRLPQTTFGAEVKAAARAGEHLAALWPSGHGRLLALLDRLLAQYDRLPTAEAALLHRDFKADHLLLTPAGLTLIDCDSCALGDPALDLGKFLADLQWWYTLADREGAAKASGHFLQGYFRGYTAHERKLGLARAHLYQVLYLLKNNVRRFNHFNASWQSQSEQMIGLAEQVIQCP
ncbi:MAG: aminoglycoside phosphotransferase family protein [Caldilineaceae bacterium]